MYWDKVLRIIMLKGINGRDNVGEKNLWCWGLVRVRCIGWK